MSTPAPTGINLPNPPPLPGAKGTPQPSPEKRREIEQGWLAMRDMIPALADLILFINAHPELIEIARQSKMGTLKVSGNFAG